MDELKKVTINLPPRLFELGLTEAQVSGLAHHWCVISLFLAKRVSAEEAGQLLNTDHDGFLNLLNTLGLLFTDTSAEARPWPELADRQQVDALTNELAQTRYQLFLLQQDLDRANRVRTDFIATVSHELRTPLNSIIGFAKLLLKQQLGPLNKIQQTDMSMIYDSAQHLLGLVNDILDLSKIDAGKISLDMDWVGVEEIVVGVIASTYILIEDKPIELKEEIEPGLPRLFADRNRIRQVVINLLSNAAKFTERGQITLKINQIQQAGQPFICFAVKDTGIGINPEDVDKVFEPFRQIDSSASRRAEGTGLGMAISYRLVKLHGGKFWVESRPGLGSTFYFSIPVEPARSLQPEYRLS